MIYDDFTLMLERAKKHECAGNSIDVDSFCFYIDKINGFLESYFESNDTERNYGILKGRASGASLEELGKRYGLSRQRTNQIIIATLSKLRSPHLVQGNVYLNNLFTFLCNIGEAEIMDFIYFLVPQKHVLLIIISGDLFKKSLEFEKEFKSAKAKEEKPKKRRETRVIKTPFCSEKEIKHVIERYLDKHRNLTTLNEIADGLMDDYGNQMICGLSGRITWDKIMDVLTEMYIDGEISRTFGKLVIS